MTEEQKNDPPGNTGGPPKPPQEPPKEEKKLRKPKTAKQIEAAKRNLAKIGKNKQSKQPVTAMAIRFAISTAAIRSETEISNSIPFFPLWAS